MKAEGRRRKVRLPRLKFVLRRRARNRRDHLGRIGQVESVGSFGKRRERAGALWGHLGYGRSRACALRVERWGLVGCAHDEAPQGPGAIQFGGHGRAREWVIGAGRRDIFLFLGGLPMARGECGVRTRGAACARVPRRDAGHAWGWVIRAGSGILSESSVGSPVPRRRCSTRMEGAGGVSWRGAIWVCQRKRRMGRYIGGLND